MCQEVLGSSLLPPCSIFVVSVISTDSENHLHVYLFPIPVFCSDMDFPGGSAGKESTCNAGDLGSIPGLGRSPGEGNSCPLCSLPLWAIHLSDRHHNANLYQVNFLRINATASHWIRSEIFLLTVTSILQEVLSTFSQHVRSPFISPSSLLLPKSRSPFLFTYEFLPTLSAFSIASFHFSLHTEKKFFLINIFHAETFKWLSSVLGITAMLCAVAWEELCDLVPASLCNNCGNCQLYICNFIH